jgi:hypothetical protein
MRGGIVKAWVLGAGLGLRADLERSD